jgi:GT2 family glycosyltransferase
MHSKNRYDVVMDSPTVAAIVINRNNRQKTEAIIKQIGLIKVIPIRIVLIDWQCVAAENMKSSLDEQNQITYYDQIDEEQIEAEVWNHGAAMVRHVPIAWIWLIDEDQIISCQNLKDSLDYFEKYPRVVIVKNQKMTGQTNRQDIHNLSVKDWMTSGGVIIRRNLFFEVGGFNANYHQGFSLIDWCYRAMLQGYEGVIIQAKTKAVENSWSLGLASYFRGRNPWLFIRLRLDRKWWQPIGRQMISLWWQEFFKHIWGMDQRARALFIQGTLDGWRLLGKD